MDGSDWSGYISGALSMTTNMNDASIVDATGFQQGSNLVIPRYVTNGTSTYEVKSVDVNGT
jgi:hypothetical protein